MEINQFECLKNTAIYNNMTKAAQKMHISQPALSTSIKLLESELAVNLFDRNGRNVTLNSTGKRVLEHVEIILSEYEAIKQLCQGIASDENNKVTVLPAVASWIVPYLLNDFCLIHPDIKLDIVIEELNAKQTVTDNTVDIAFMASIAELSNSNYSTLYKEELMIAVPLDHVLADHDEIKLIELKPHSIISLTEGRPLRAMEDAFCNLAGFTPKRRMECDSSALICELIEGGCGPVFFPTVLWRNLNLSKSRLLRITDPSCFRYISMRIGKTKKKNDSAVMKTYDYIMYLMDNRD